MICFTQDDFNHFKKIQSISEKENKTVFLFKNQEYLTTFAKHLIECIEDPDSSLKITK
jgi:hypothetical protein